MPRRLVLRGEYGKSLLRRRGEFVELIGQLFPHCPAAEATAIAEHTAVRGSGRVGRSEADRNLEDKALTLAAWREKGSAH